MADKRVTLHLLLLKPGVGNNEAHKQLKDPPLIAGIPHGWVHPPLHLDREKLTGHKWNFFAVTEPAQLAPSIQELCEASISISVTLAKLQYEHLAVRQSSRPTASNHTPPLPQEWHSNRPIPAKAVVEDKASIGSGTLRLDNSMASFLSGALPAEVANAPVSLFNLFKYKDNDRSVHDAYMEGFKQKFGDTAGATVKFMGPVDGELTSQDGSSSSARWDDANLVQYDTIWHYAYMLSTDVYQELNKQKVAGLEDTCILVVSEVEVMDG